VGKLHGGYYTISLLGRIENTSFILFMTRSNVSNFLSVPHILIGTAGDHKHRTSISISDTAQTHQYGTYIGTFNSCYFIEYSVC
jgi:hypothetical protein